MLNYLYGMLNHDQMSIKPLSSLYNTFQIKFVISAPVLIRPFKEKSQV